MKILLLNYSDTGGGAATASLRIAKGLYDNHIDVTLGVVEKKTVNPFVTVLPPPKHFKYPKLISFFIRSVKKLNTKVKDKTKPFKTTNRILHSENIKSKIDVNWINNSDFDVVNLHWINNDMISIEDIAKINKPIVWTMHDSWPCCGAEHHPNILESDKRWTEVYSRFNKPVSTKGPDICKKTWYRKYKYLRDRKIHFIAPSNWEKDILKQSKLFGNSSCTVIPNIIPSDIFFKKDKFAIRNSLGIPDNKKVLGFGAAYDIDNPKSLKGGHYLIEALLKLKGDEYFLVIFGPAGTEFTSKIGIPFFNAGYITNDTILSCLYSVCDCFVNPSLIENLPTTCLEALFCGVPVAAFDTGGTKDTVEHKITGYLAKPFDTTDLATGIEYCIENRDLLSENALKIASTDFIASKSIDSYLQVFEDTIKG